MSKRLYLWAAALLGAGGIAFGGSFLFPSMDDMDMSDDSSDIASEETAPATYRTAPLTISKNFSTLLLSGTVKSYQSASITPRTDGIVSDVLVETGDAVTEGQILATLLPHGVEGAANAAIAAKRAEALRAQTEYTNSLSVSSGMVSLAEKTLAQKQTALDTARRLAAAKNDTAKVTAMTTAASASAGTTVAEKNIATAEATLSSSKAMLEAAQKERAAKLAQADTEVSQMTDTAASEAHDAYVMISGMLGIDRGQAARGLGSEQLSGTLGNLNASSRSEFVANFNAAGQKLTSWDSKKETSVDAVLTAVETMLTSANALYKNSSPNSDFSQAMLDSGLATVHEARSKILTARQDYAKAVQERTTMIAMQDAAITDLTAKVQENETMLASAKEALTLAQKEQQKDTSMTEKERIETATEQETDIARMEAEVATEKEALELAKKQQKQETEMRRAELAAQEAELARELTESGHTLIRAPKSGIIAKRSIRPGDNVMATSPAFELTGTDTSLGKSAPLAIEFGAPENLFALLAEGMPVDIMASDKNLPATITRKSGSIDPASRTFTLLAELTDKSVVLPDNTNVRIRVQSEKNPAWNVPATAVKTSEGKSYVWTLANSQKPEKQEVALLAKDGEFADIRGENLSSSTAIVLDPPESFLDTKGATGASNTETAANPHGHD